MKIRRSESSATRSHSRRCRRDPCSARNPRTDATAEKRSSMLLMLTRLRVMELAWRRQTYTGAASTSTFAARKWAGMATWMSS